MRILAPEFTLFLREKRLVLQNAIISKAGRGVSRGMVAVRVGFERFRADVVTHPWRLLLAFAIAALFGAWFGVRAFALWSVFLLFAFYDWENRIVGVLALLSLVSCPVLLQLKRDDQAEVMAVYAYFFLAMTVGLQLIEYKRFPERFPEDEDESV